MIKILIEIISTKIVMRFPKSIFYNNIACESTEEIEKHKWLPSRLKLLHPREYFLSPSLNDWLKSSNVCFRKEGIECTSSDAM